MSDTKLEERASRSCFHLRSSRSPRTFRARGRAVDFLKRRSPAVPANQEAWRVHVGGRIGFDCHRTSARHIWHGDAKHRQCVTRDEIFRAHHFNPERHGKSAPETGLLRWTNEAPKATRNYDEAVRQIDTYVKHYNEVRLHSAISYITPADCLCGLAAEIHAERDRKLEEARMRRRGVSQAQSFAIAG